MSTDSPEYGVIAFKCFHCGDYLTDADEYLARDGFVESHGLHTLCADAFMAKLEREERRVA